jgi:hypothetical protein
MWTIKWSKKSWNINSKHKPNLPPPPHPTEDDNFPPPVIRQNLLSWTFYCLSWPFNIYCTLSTSVSHFTFLPSLYPSPSFLFLYPLFIFCSPHWHRPNPPLPPRARRGTTQNLHRCKKNIYVCETQQVWISRISFSTEENFKYSSNLDWNEPDAASSEHFVLFWKIRCMWSLTATQLWVPWYTNFSVLAQDGCLVSTLTYKGTGSPFRIGQKCVIGQDLLKRTASPV